MDLKLIYHGLCKVSDWTIRHYYSEALAIGQEHVPLDGPLIIASSHQNETIDIAAIGGTIGRKRHVSFWAKSSLFKVPVIRSIVNSAGAIPVERNPNKAVPTTVIQGTLFESTSKALHDGGAICIFPEGSSSTEPSLALLYDGISYAALEFALWETKHVDGSGPSQHSEPQSKKLRIVPVGTVYTDKTSFRSRILIQYGNPIILDVDEIAGKLAHGGEEALKSEAKKLTASIEQELLRLTVNTADWDTLYSALMARDILWKSPDSIPLKDYTRVQQSLSDLFLPYTPSSDNDTLHIHRDAARKALVKYLGLLQHTGIDHATLTYLYPAHALPSPSPLKLLFTALTRIPLTFLHPLAILFAPVYAVHLPGYILGSITSRLLPKEREYEAVAQFKVIFGGLGAGLGYAATMRGLIYSLRQLGVGTWQIPTSTASFGFASRYLTSALTWLHRSGASDALVALGRRLAVPPNAGLTAHLKSSVSTIMIGYVAVWSVIRWHNALVDGNRKRWNQLTTSWKLFLGSLSSPLTGDKLAPFEAPPLRYPNPWLKHRSYHVTGLDGSVISLSNNRASSVSGRAPVARLVPHLIHARREAVDSLRMFLATVGRDSRTAVSVGYLRKQGLEI